MTLVPVPARAALRGATRSLLTLPSSVALAFAVTGGIGAVAPEAQLRGGQPLFFATVALCTAGGGATWAWALLRGSGGASRAARRGAASGFGVAMPLALWGLTRVETTLLERQQAGAAYPMHVAFAVLFPVATALVVFGAALGLALALRPRRAALGLASRAALVAASVFALVTLAMDVGGWRVGAPNAEARSTMLVVLGVGLVAATLAGGAVVGKALLVGRR